MTTIPCPCGNANGHRHGHGHDTTPLSDCCGRYHDGPLAGQAPTAEALMRSRYSAFVLDRTDYLLATWHPRTRPVAIEPNEPGLRWLGLTVRQHRVIDADRAEVSFVARSKLGGRAHRLEETSRFVREHGRWYYVDGDVGAALSGRP